MTYLINAVANDDELKVDNYVIIACLNSELTLKLIKRIPGW